MIYLDNAATSHFKPKSVVDAVISEIKNSSNSGRSGHKLAVSNGLKNEQCRRYLLENLGAESDYQLVFTKNCTEALNLAILGSLNHGDHAITSTIEHNSVLRPLFELKREGKIDLDVVALHYNSPLCWEDIAPRIKPTTRLITLNLVSNVTGAVCNVDEISNGLQALNMETKPLLLLDGSQGVPIIPVNLQKSDIDMLALPAHKGLHGVQGVGFLIFKNTIPLRPLIYGGTGTASISVYQPTEPPEAYESGTQFSAGIHGLYEGAKWSFENVGNYSKSVKALCEKLLESLSLHNITIYTADTRCGVVSFNIPGVDSSSVADFLSSSHNIACRSGLHCAPLVHKQLKTIVGGAVRCSLGADTKESDIRALISAIEDILALHRRGKI